MTSSYITQLVGSGATAHFADQYGNPVLLLSETNWSLIPNAGSQSSHPGFGTYQEDIDYYCNSRGAQGFTGIQVCVFSATANDTDYPYGSTWDGVYPFNGGAPNDPAAGLYNTFWTRVDYFIAACARNNMVAWLNLSYGTADDPSQPGPFYSPTTGNNQITTAQAEAFGTDLAARYASTPNIIWQYGGDYFTGTWDNLLTGILTGLRSGGDTHLISIENSTETSSRYSFDSGNFNSEQAFGYASAQFNCVYTYIQSYFGIRYAYGEASTLPVIWVDGYYYLSDGGDTYYAPYDRGERQVMWWALSSGAIGINPTSTFVWPWSYSSDSYNQTTNEYFFVHIAGNMRSAVEALPGWWKLLPDLTGTFITAGGGTPRASDTYDEDRIDYGNAFTDDFVTASVASDGSVALIYLSNASTITINQAKLQANYTVKWIDPSTGAVHAGTPGSTYNSGAVDGTKAILNSTGDPDWVLALVGPTPGPAATGPPLYGFRS